VARKSINPPAGAATTPSEAEPTFEQSLSELEQIAHDLEEGQLGLNEALARYEQGVKLLRHCHGLLEGAQRRIEILTGVDPQGNPITQPFAHVASLVRDAQQYAESPPPPDSPGRASPLSGGASDVDESGGSG